MAGDLLSASAYFDSDWHTVLVGGGGPGFAGLYALDMTAATYDSSDGSDNKLLFEKAAPDGFGHIYGKPQVAVDPVGTRPGNWVFTSSGSAARYAAEDYRVLTDLTICGIIDFWEEQDQVK